jgi:hypothetical protein
MCIITCYKGVYPIPVLEHLAFRQTNQSMDTQTKWQEISLDLYIGYGSWWRNCAKQWILSQAPHAENTERFNSKIGKYHWIQKWRLKFTCTTSIPFATLPNTVCLLSSHGVATVVIKNWEPFVFGPAFAIDTVKGLSCRKLQKQKCFIQSVACDVMHRGD